MKRILPFLLLLAAVSCEFEFPLDDTVDPVLSLQFHPVNGEAPQLLVCYAEPSFRKAQPDAYGFKVSDVTLKLNGAAVALKENTEGSMWNRHLLDLPEGMVFSPGDSFELSVQGHGVPSVSAETSIPRPPVIESLTIEPATRDSSEAWKLRLKLDRPVSDDEYYGIMARRRLATYALKGADAASAVLDTTVMESWITPGQIASTADLNKLDLDMYASVNYEDGFVSAGLFSSHPMTLLSSRQFDGAEYTFYANSIDSFSYDFGFDIDFDPGEPLPGDDEDMPYDPDEPYVPIYWLSIGQKEEYQVYLYRLSPEFYNYAKAQYLSAFNMLSNFGVTPPNFTYSNVSGGIGVVAGLSVASTGWEEVPERPDSEVKPVWPAF